MLQPVLSLIYRETAIHSDGTSLNPSASIFTAAFITGNYTVMSIATISSIPLSHHNSMIECQTGLNTTSRRISVAGK